MKKIRVLLAHHPLAVPTAIRELLSQQEDMELVGDCRGPMSILREVGRTMADAVKLAQEEAEEPDLCSQLLAVYRSHHSEFDAGDGGCIYLQQLCTHREKREIGQLAALLRFAPFC